MASVIARFARMEAVATTVQISSAVVAGFRARGTAPRAIPRGGDASPMAIPATGRTVAAMVKRATSAARMAPSVRPRTGMVRLVMGTRLRASALFGCIREQGKFAGALEGRGEHALVPRTRP